MPVLEYWGMHCNKLRTWDIISCSREKCSTILEYCLNWKIMSRIYYFFDAGGVSGNKLFKKTEIFTILKYSFLDTNISTLSRITKKILHRMKIKLKNYSNKFVLVRYVCKTWSWNFRIIFSEDYLCTCFFSICDFSTHIVNVNFAKVGIYVESKFIFLRW